MDVRAPQGRKFGTMVDFGSHPSMEEGEGGRVISPRGKSYPEGAPRGKNPLCTHFYHAWIQAFLIPSF